MASPGRVGPYRLQAELGRGGGGVVYRGVHAETGEVVAVKTVPAPRAEMLQGIRREIHALSRLEHPGVVRILAKGDEDGTPWYAMELIRGATLLDHAGAHPLPGGLRPRLSVMRRLCAPLGYLHGEGIVHGDLKPRNVLVRASGMPVLVDFGLARQTSGESRRESLEVHGESGTAAFMAPEQLKGELCDARADLYALGCVLYLLLTGRPPFSTLQDVLDEDTLPPLPSSMAPLPRELDALVLRLLSKRPRERLGHADEVAESLSHLGAEDGLAAGGPPARSFAYRPPLAGRDALVEAFASFVGRPLTGAGGVALVGGESGVGKTRFLVEAVRRVRGRLRTITSECRPADGTSARTEAGAPLLALRPVLQAAGDLCREGGREATARILGPRGKVLAAYEPSLATLPDVASAPEPADLPPAEARQRLFLYLVQTLAAMAAEAPLLVLIDDLHWADDLTLELLSAAAPTLEGLPLLVVATHRTEETGAALRALAERRDVRHLTIGRLPPDAVASMVEEMLAASPPPGFVSHLERHSEGNPFFVTQYVQAAIEEGILVRRGDGAWHLHDGAAYERMALPGALLDLVARRLDGLTPAAREVLEAGAVLGRVVDGEVLSAVAGLAEDGILEATVELLARHVLEAGPGGSFRFAHDKLREVAYDRLDGGRRAGLHERAARTIEARGGSVDQAALGHHWDRAGLQDRAAPCYLAAARAAAKVYAHAEAERLYERYLAIAPGPTAERAAAGNELGAIALLRGRTAQAEALHAAAIEESRRAGAAILEAQSLWLFGDVQRNVGRKEQAWELYEQALAIVRREGERTMEGRLLGNLGVIRKEQGRLEEARELWERSLAISIETGNVVQRATVLGNLANMLHEVGRTVEAEPAMRESAALAAEGGDRRLEARLLANLGVLVWEAGRVEEAWALYERALLVDREVGDRRHEGIMLGNLGTLRWERGRLADARQLYEQALAIAREVGNRRNEVIVLRNLAGLADEQGRHEEARGLHERALHIARETGDRRDEGIALDNLAANARARGDEEGAWEMLEEALRIHREVRNRRSEGAALGMLGLLQHTAGRMDEARASFEEALAIHREVVDPRHEGIRLGQLARHVLLTTGDWREATELAMEGDRRLEGTYDIDRGTTLGPLGHALLASGRSAAGTLALVETIARAVSDGGASNLDAAMVMLARAQRDFDAGVPLVGGHAAGDVTPGQRRWLAEHRPGTIAGA